MIKVLEIKKKPGKDYQGNPIAVLELIYKDEKGNMYGAETKDTQDDRAIAQKLWQAIRKQQKEKVSIFVPWNQQKSRAIYGELIQALTRYRRDE